VSQGGSYFIFLIVIFSAAVRILIIWT